MNGKEKSLFFPSKYWGVTITPLLATKASIRGDTQPFHIKSSPQMGAELLLNYYYVFEEDYSLIFGAGGGVLAHNFDFAITKEMFSPPTGSDIMSNGAASREMDLFYIKLPVELERRKTNPNGAWNTNVGFDLLFSPPQQTQMGYTVFLYSGQQHRYLIIDQNIPGRSWLNYHVVGGYSWNLANQNKLRVNLKVNLSFTDFAKAHYQFNFQTPYDIEGQYRVSGSYIGLSIGYLFSGRK